MKTIQLQPRPPCSCCGMRMIVSSPLKNCRESYECLRCGHTETLRIDDKGVAGKRAAGKGTTRKAARVAKPAPATKPASVHSPGFARDKDYVNQLKALFFASLELPPAASVKNLRE
jgi:hypothetical protein